MLLGPEWSDPDISEGGGLCDLASSETHERSDLHCSGSRSCDVDLTDLTTGGKTEEVDEKP